MADSNRILPSFLESLLAKWGELTRPETRHHPNSPDAIEVAIASLKHMATHLLAYEPGVLVYELDDRFVIDVSRRGTATDVSDLRCVAECVDRELLAKQPAFSWEFRIDGNRYPEFFQGREYSRTRFDYPFPCVDIRDVAYTIERGVQQRFGTEPFITVYQTARERYDVHVSLDQPDQHDVLRGRLRSLLDVLRERHRHLEFRLLVDREPLSPGRSLIEPRGAALDLGSVDFGPALRLY